jgi:hypothetical protein
MIRVGALVSSLCLAVWWSAPCPADGPSPPIVWVPAPPAPGCPPTCDRYVPLPPHNPGISWYNLLGTGKDDPWRPPKVWPETRYPVVPAYTRPSYGYYETSWRVLSVCGAVPAVPESTLGVTPPPPPGSYVSPAVAPPTRPAPAATTIPQTGPPATQPAPVVVPQVTPPIQAPPGGPQTGPPRATPPVVRPRPRRPQAVAPAPGPQVVPPPNKPQGALEFEMPVRTTMANPANEEPEIAVRPF